jgi:hypothetical protein
MRQAAKRARQAGRWVESEIRRSIKGFGERPSMPYRLEHPGHDDIVYSRPPPPTSRRRPKGTRTLQPASGRAPSWGGR